MRIFFRILTALLCVALVAGVTYGAQFLQRPVAEQSEYAATQISLSSVALTCPGPAQLADGDWERDPAFDPSPVGTTSAVAGVVLDPSRPAEAGLQDLSGAPAKELKRGLDAAVGVVEDPGTRALWARPGNAGIVRAAGVASSITTAGDLRSLGAMSCGRAQVEQWLVGGTTVRGSSSRLVMQNPSQTPAAVQIDVWGPSGKLELSGPSSFSVPAGGQTATLLEGLASEQRRLTIRVASTGALVSSYVQVNELDGVRPLGMDFVPPAAAPTERQVVTGLTVQDSEIGDDAAASVRLLAPGDAAASVKLTILGKRGRELLPGAELVDLEPGAVTDVSLAGLPAGTYSVVLESDEPVVAGGRFSRVAKPLDGQKAKQAPAEFAFVGSRALSSAVESVVADTDAAEAESLTGPGADGVLALPRSGTTRLNLLLVPDAVRDVASAGSVPDASADDTKESEDDANKDKPKPKPKPSKDSVELQVTLVDEAGHSIGTYPVAVEPGTVKVVHPAKLTDGKRAAAAYVTAPPETAAQLSWSGFSRVGEASDELVSVLLPVPAIDTRSEIILRPGTSTGLGVRAAGNQNPM